MIPGALARRYARALLALAPSPAARDKFAKDLVALAEIAKSQDDAQMPVLTVLASRRFPQAERKKLLGALARRIDADPMVVKFLEYVLERDRLEGLPDIARAYVRMADEAGGRVQAAIVSAAPLSPDAVSGIKHALERATGKQVVMATSVDPELIGGVVAKVGSYVLDGSLKTALARMRTELKEA
ncbi:MAG TPA: ATP synthase F1 subunit delta [Nannocystaceae bacterium]|nr:ATP synthase F1 subunit delta [Nannocystaceae bacterium]